ncbi:hypothetical protein OB03_10990 [Brevundimonas sp. GN22]
MKLTKRHVMAAAASLTLLGAGSVIAQAAMTKVPSEVQAGTYKLDSSHGNITWSVNHLGFSQYYGQFANATAELKLDSANPSASTLTATIPMGDVATTSAGLTRHLKNADFFDVENHPTATFTSRSLRVDASDPTKATVEGDLTLRGVTKPVTMEVKFNQAGPSMGGTYKAGFDGRAMIKRSDFGITYGLPAIGDDVKLHIEGEFVRQ